MNKSFKIKALFEQTNRTRTVFLTAKSIQELAIILHNKGFVEPFDIEEIKPESPTDPQLSYAKSLSINIPFGISKDDLSVLISRKIEDDSDPSAELVDYATNMGFSFSKYIGEKQLYNLNYENLELRDKLAFFIFSIYRYLSGDIRENLLVHPFKEKFYSFSDEMKSDKKFVKSALNYKGEELRFFGTVRFADGVESIGASINTIAYKAASEYVSQTFGTQKTKIFKSEQIFAYELSTNNRNHSICQGKKSNFRCGSLMALFILFAIAIVWTVNHVL